MILPLGRWVLHEACERGAAWVAAASAQGGRAPVPPLTINVNISARQLEDPALLRDVADALRSSGLAPECLMLEITERVFLDHASATLETLRALKALGVGLAIDDFGTRSANPAYLERFPIDVLKLDRAFVTNLGGPTNDAATARTVVALGDRLALRVVAEGIETVAERERLQEMGCVSGQGYLFTRPVAAEEISLLIRTRHAVVGMPVGMPVGLPVGMAVGAGLGGARVHAARKLG
jgi:EAL domain-containing protein (putative c-di-GMP-specific phosphodiesterase class I)